MLVRTVTDLEFHVIMLEARVKFLSATPLVVLLHHPSIPTPWNLETEETEQTDGVHP